MKSKFNKRILFLIQEAGSLLQMPRAHLRSLGNTYDTVASHSHHTSVIAYCVARMENLSHKEAMKAVTMATFHDLVEARTGDPDFISKNYNKDDEEKAVKDQFSDITFGADLEELLKEYNDRKTLIAKCVKDADSLAQMHHEWSLTWRGNKLAQQWFEGDFIERVPGMYTKSAKKLAFAMKDSNPNEWWWDEFVTKDGKAKNIDNLLGKKSSSKRKRG